VNTSDGSVVIVRKYGADGVTTDFGESMQTKLQTGNLPFQNIYNIVSVFIFFVFLHIYSYVDFRSIV
jgi:hypothetical protein